MSVPTAPTPLRRLRTHTPGRRVPLASKAGGLAILAGVVADLVEHGVVSHEHDALIAGFPVGEHLAHLAVLVGMVLVLLGVIADGVRHGGRHTRPEGSNRNAVR